jgi:hypothetical protein
MLPIYQAYNNHERRVKKLLTMEKEVRETNLSQPFFGISVADE